MLKRGATYICTDRCVHVNNVHTDGCMLAKMIFDCTFPYFETVLCLSWPQTCYIVKDDLELLILPPPPPEG